MSFFSNIGKFISTLPEAAARVYTVGFKTVFSIVPAFENILGGKVTGTAAAKSMDAVANSSENLLSYLLTPPASITNPVINSVILNWIKKNWLLLLLFLAGVIMLFKSMKHKKRK